jgi:hypothetical protein
VLSEDAAHGIEGQSLGERAKLIAQSTQLSRHSAEGFFRPTLCLFGPGVIFRLSFGQIRENPS